MRVVYFLSVVLFYGAISLLVIAVLFMQLFATPQAIKTSLKTSEAYQAFVDTVIVDMHQQAKESISTDISEEQFQNMFEEALPAEAIQVQAEDAIDDIYFWLDGEVERPEFTLDFSDARENFAHSIGTYATQRLRDLPTCTSPEQIPRTIDPLAIECVPPGVDPATAGENYTQRLLASDDFFSDVTLSSEDLLSSIGFFDEDANTPQTFQWLKSSLWMLLPVVLLSILAIVFSARSKREGWRKAGLHLALAGLSLGLSAGIVFVFADTLLKAEGASTMQLALMQAVRMLIDSALVILSFIAGAYILLGVMLRYVVARAARTRATDETTTN